MGRYVLPPPSPSRRALQASSTDPRAALVVLGLHSPIRYTASEVNGTLDRAKYLISIAEKSLAPVAVEEQAGFKRFLKKEALGVVAIISPWKCVALAGCSM